jgi:hypothetical protein
MGAGMDTHTYTFKIGSRFTIIPAKSGQTINWYPV